MKIAFLCLILCLTLAATQGTNQKKPAPKPATNKPKQASNQPEKPNQVKPQKPIQQKFVEPPSVVHTQQQLQKSRLQAEKAAKAEQQRLKLQSPEAKARIQQEQRLRAERTAKYKAEQERIKKIRQKQKQAAEKKQKDMGAQQKPEFKSDGKPQKTAVTKTSEREEYYNVIRKNAKALSSSTRKIMFEVGKKIEQFIINPSSNDEIVIQFTLYIEKDNVFSEVSNVETEEPIKVYIYEDNQRIVAQGSFFFQFAINFSIKAGSVYVIRFYNSGSLKLVTMNYNHFISSEASKKMYDAEKGAVQFQKAISIITGIKSSLSDLQNSKLINITNSYVFVEAMQKYFVYQILQIIAVSVVCVLQVQFIKKMFKSVSIL